MAMEEFTSQIENNIVEIESEVSDKNDLCHELRIQYRLTRKKISRFLRNLFKKNFTNILLITVDTPPTDYITMLQKQYPDKVISVLVPLFSDEDRHMKKTSVKIDYYIQGKTSSAYLYKIPDEFNNIQIYGVFTEEFARIENKQDIYNIKNISRFVKIARKIALKLKPGVIHAENIPFFAGLELESRWSSGYPIKTAQFFNNYRMYEETEPFIAAVTFANKKEIKKICRDNTIKNCISAIFNASSQKNIKKTETYINYILKKYDEYRKNVSQKEDTKENINLRRMNERILKMFPQMAYKKEQCYNPIYYSLKQASAKVIHTLSDDKPSWADSIADTIYLPLKCTLSDNYKLHENFNQENFRDTRFLNKKYIIREFSRKRIELKFFDLGIFEEEDTGIRGYLEPFISTPLIFYTINAQTTLQDIKTATLSILKAFEEGKNIQVIYNYPKGLNNSYLNSLFDFVESQTVLNGRWVALEGKIKIPQFLAASDMILIPSSNSYKIEPLLFNALKQGCIPLISGRDFTNYNISDIFDNLVSGCVFKTKKTDNNDTEFESLLIKTLDFYNTNNSSWNLIIKNAMNYDCSWDFKSLEEYNNIYEELI